MGNASRWCGLVLAGVVLAGCVRVDDRLSLAADGSAQVSLTVVPVAQVAGVDSLHSVLVSHFRAWDLEVYPPWSVDQAHRLLAGAQDVVVSRTAEGTLTVGGRFAGPTQLMASPYGRLHQLRLARHQDRLTVTAMLGGQVLSLIETLPDTVSSEGLDLAGLRAAASRSSVTFRLVLPAAAAAEGTAASGREVAWTCARTDGAASGDFCRLLARPLSASCALPDGFPLPEPPVRLALPPLQITTTTLAPVDLRQAAQVLPLWLVTRNGQGRTWSETGNRNPQDVPGTELCVQVRVPERLKPMRWSGIRFTAASDDQGNNLLPGTPSVTMLAPERELDPDGHATLTTFAQRFTGQVLAPAITSTRISRLAGAIDCFYPATRRVLVLARSFALDRLEHRDEVLGGSTSYGQPLAIDGDLPGGLVVSSGHRNRLGAQLVLSGAVSCCDLEQIQAFDANDHPLPTWGDGWTVRIGGISSGWIKLAAVVIMPAPPLPLDFELRDLPWRSQTETQP